MNSAERQIIYVDIDGTLTNETDGYGEIIYAQRTPKKDIINAINKLHKEGHIIIIWTSRWKEDERITRKWLIDNGVEFDKIKFRKPLYDILIEDKTVTPVNLWTEYLKKG